jgi:hypothetical protein
MIFLLIWLIIVQLTTAEIWSTTTTNCLWHEYISNDHLNQRIDLRDIRNQLLT